MDDNICALRTLYEGNIVIPSNKNVILLKTLKGTKKVSFNVNSTYIEDIPTLITSKLQLQDINEFYIKNDTCIIYHPVLTSYSKFLKTGGVQTIFLDTNIRDENNTKGDMTVYTNWMKTTKGLVSSQFIKYITYAEPDNIILSITGESCIDKLTCLLILIKKFKFRHIYVLLFDITSDTCYSEIKILIEQYSVDKCIIFLMNPIIGLDSNKLLNYDTLTYPLITKNKDYIKQNKIITMCTTNNSLSGLDYCSRGIFMYSSLKEADLL